MFSLSSPAKHTKYHNKTSCTSQLIISHESVRGTEPLQHTQLCAAGQSEGGAVQDPGHPVERSEPRVQLTHANRNTAQFGRWI